MYNKKYIHFLFNLRKRRKNRIVEKENTIYVNILTLTIYIGSTGSLFHITYHVPVEKEKT